jgi:kynurenine formamidase
MTPGDVFPQERPFEIESVFSWDIDGLRTDNFSVYGEQGTRLLLYSSLEAVKDGPKLDEIDIVLQDTVVVDVPKGPKEVVTGEEVERACAKADFRQGDALIVRTGWGDGERYYKLGRDYELKSPYYGGDETWKKIVEILTAKKCPLFCYDTANAMNMAESYRDWVEQKPRPKPWPSPEAKARVRKEFEALQLKKMPEEGRVLLRVSRARINMIGGLVNCGEIKKERVKLIALPLRVKGATAAPCNVVAIEE